MTCVSRNYEIILSCCFFLFLKTFISRYYDIVGHNYDLGVLVFGF